MINKYIFTIIGFLILFSIMPISALEKDIYMDKVSLDSFSTSSTSWTNVTGLNLTLSPLNMSFNRSYNLYWSIGVKNTLEVNSNFSILVDGVRKFPSEIWTTPFERRFILNEHIDMNNISLIVQPQVLTSGGVLTLTNLDLVIQNGNTQTDFVHDFSQDNSSTTYTNGVYEEVIGLNQSVVIDYDSKLILSLSGEAMPLANDGNLLFQIKVDDIVVDSESIYLSRGNKIYPFNDFHIPNVTFSAGQHNISVYMARSNKNVQVFNKKLIIYFLTDNLGHTLLNNYNEVPPVGTTSTSMIDVADSNFTLTIDTPQKIWIVVHGEIESNQASSPTSLYLLLNNSVVETYNFDFRDAGKSEGFGFASLSDSIYPSGDYDIRLKWNVTSGISNLNNLHLGVFGTGFDVCDEVWNPVYSACNVSDKRVKTYVDSASCNTTYNFPVDNGTIEDCDYCSPQWDCSSFDSTCGGIYAPAILNCLNVVPQNSSCCPSTNLTSDCNFLTVGNYSDYNKLCGLVDLKLNVPTYPHVDLNVTYPVKLYMMVNNVTSNISTYHLNLTDPSGNSTLFDFGWDGVEGNYLLNLLFLEEGNYPFIIYADYPYEDIPEITGTLIVREPYYITLNGFNTKSNTVYKNEYAYLIAELTTSKKYYDETLEQYLTPLFYNSIYTKTAKVQVFYAPYTSGSATIKLWEEGEYAFRLIDGQMTFDGTYAIPNITDSYGVNSFLGLFTFNGTSEGFNLYFDEQDLHQYRWLANWIFIISLIMISVIAFFLFFVLPQYSYISIIFGLGFTTMLVVVRVALFIWKGY